MKTHLQKLPFVISAWIIGIGALIATTFLVWMFGGSFINYARALPALGNIHFFAGNESNSSFYELGFFGSEKKSFELPGKLIDYAKAGSTQVGVVFVDPKTNNQELYVLSKKSTPLTADGFVKASPSVSHDGKLVAYANFILPQGKELNKTLAKSAPDDWEIKTVVVGTGKMRTLAKGYAPHFFMSNGKEFLFFMTNRGFSIADDTGLIVYSYVVEGRKQPLYPLSVISPDGTKVAMPNIQEGNFEIFTIDYPSDSAMPILSSRGTLPAAAYSVVFGYGTVFALAGSQSATALLAAPTDNLSKMYTVRTFADIAPYHLSI